MLWPRRLRGLAAWDPWREMRRLQGEMNRLFGDIVPAFARRVFPPVNVWTGKGDAVVTAELPGVAPGDLDISVVGDTLTLKGARKADELGEGHAALRRERETGQFTRTIQLPYRVDPEKVEAEYRRGILRISLPRLEADKPKQIAVNVGS